MSTVRLCSDCGRHNGPVFTHCIVCGQELPDPPADPPHIAADKAQRYLDQLDIDRRRLLPAKFLRAVERQAGVAEDIAGQSGSVRSVTDSAELQLSSIAGARSFLGPRRRDHPADVVTQPDFPALVSPAFDLGGVIENKPPPPNPTLPPESADEHPIWRDPRRDPSSADFPDLASGDHVPVVPKDLEDVHSLASLESIQVPSLNPLDPPSGTPVTAAMPSVASPLGRALSQGNASFGPRDATFRLLMLPDPGYRSRIHFLQHRLAQTLELDLFKARQCLQREQPTFLRSSEDPIDVEGMAEHLRAGGVRVLLVHRDSWLKGAEPVTVHTASGPPPGPVEFTTGDGRLRVYRADLAWACIAEITPDPDFGSGAGSTQPAASMTAETRRGKSWWLMDVVRHSSRSPLRIRSDQFDFDCLGGEATMAAHLNLRKLLAWLSPDAGAPLRVDDSFKRVPHAAGLGARGNLDDEASLIASREIEFTEYVLLLDAGQRDVP
ncbi:MAG: hypothetical protein GY898_03650 [Proteobacteria bacterium]|nr:hypothetical protein [Pseudomonadota bacterium]